MDAIDPVAFLDYKSVYVRVNSLLSSVEDWISII